MTWLQQFARSQIANESSIGGEKVVGGQVFKLGPAHFVVNAVLDFAGEIMHGEELQIYRAAVTVVVADVGDLGTNYCMNAKLFFQFARKRFFRAFAGFDFAAGKLPLRGHGLVWTALADQYFSAAHNQGRGNKAQCRAVRSGCRAGLNLRHRFSLNPTNPLFGGPGQCLLWCAGWNSRFAAPR